MICECPLCEQCGPWCQACSGAQDGDPASRRSSGSECEVESGQKLPEPGAEAGAAVSSDLHKAPVEDEDSELDTLLGDLAEDLGDENEVYVVTPPGSALPDSGCALSVVGHRDFEKHRVALERTGRTIEIRRADKPREFRFGNA